MMVMTVEFPPLDRFIKMEDEDVAPLVSSSVGRVGVLAPDGNRRAGMILWGLDPSKKGFDKDVSSKIHLKSLEVIKTFIENGVKVLFNPVLLHRNFDRGRVYIEASIRYGMEYFFHDPAWLSFYEEDNVSVKFYGDKEFVRQEGHEYLLDLMQELEERTAANDGATLFFGIACSRSREEVRLSSMGIDFYNELGRAPTKAELVRAYYGFDVPDVGFFVRSNEVRDSDCQPILVSGSKVQMYFPVIPLALLSKKMIRCILYDVIVNREGPRGHKIYSRSDIDKSDISGVKEYYTLNQDAVIGLGLREGSFWLPYTRIEIPFEAHDVTDLKE